VPARVGEFARGYALTKEEPKVPFSAALASLAVDRLFDAFVVLMLTVIAMLLPSFPRGARVGDVSTTRVAIVGTILLAVLAVIVSEHPRAPDYYKARLAGIEGLSHVSIEVNPYTAPTGDRLRGGGGMPS